MSPARDSRGDQTWQEDTNRRCKMRFVREVARGWSRSAHRTVLILPTWLALNRDERSCGPVNTKRRKRTDNRMSGRQAMDHGFWKMGPDGRSECALLTVRLDQGVSKPCFRGVNLARGGSAWLLMSFPAATNKGAENCPVGSSFTPRGIKNSRSYTAL